MLALFLHGLANTQLSCVLEVARLYEESEHAGSSGRERPQGVQYSSPTRLLSLDGSSFEVWGLACFMPVLAA